MSGDGSAPALDNSERRLLSALRAEPERAWHTAGLLEATGWTDQAQVAGAAQRLAWKGLVDITETTVASWSLGAEGERALEHGLLEQRLVDWIRGADAPTMDALSVTFDRSESGTGVGLLKSLGVAIEQGTLVLPADTAALAADLENRATFLQQLSGGAGGEAALADDLLVHFAGRRGLIARSERASRTCSVSPAGLALDESALVEQAQIIELTPELIRSGAWRDTPVKPYDVDIPSPTLTRGRTHPLAAIIERVRQVFLSLGFHELEDDYVHSAGWNMDALFIPQDHPAREMQDTFHLDEPQILPVNEDDLRRWAAVHEHGGETGSTGWGGTFSDDVARQGVLRTHTTVATIHHLAANPSEPCRVFGVGRVFRKESIDRTHLPEFHQIEGIIMEPGANLPMLIGTLMEFYRQMGYPDVRVRPAYFPYTEPSMEVEVKWRGRWLELGGSGVFRPEVTEPLGCVAPVIAWGMGLERLAMLVLGLDDIRQLYMSDLEWLGSKPIL